jgi:hypothetical protein
MRTGKYATYQGSTSGMAIARPAHLRSGALSGRSCPPPQVRRALQFLVKFHAADANTSAGIGILVAPNLVLTCEHVGSPRANDYFCRCVTDDQSTSKRVVEIYEEDQTIAIPSSRFQAYFPSKVIAPLKERLAIARLSEPMAVTQFPTISNWIDGKSYTHTGLVGGQGGCVPTLLEGIEVQPESWTSSLVCVWPKAEGDSTPVPGDSGGGLFEFDSDWKHLMAIQHAIGTYEDSPSIVSMHIPIARACSWIDAIRSITK